MTMERGHDDNQISSHCCFDMYLVSRQSWWAVELNQNNPGDKERERNGRGTKFHAVAAAGIL